MSTTKRRACWRKDLSAFRGLSDSQRTGFLLLLEWFENYRLRYELEASRETAKAFWRSEVIREDRERQPWQLEQWNDAIQWYLNWLDACAQAQTDHRSLEERLRVAINSVGARLGHARKTKQAYGA